MNNKEQKTPSNRSIFTPMKNNYCPSPGNYYNFYNNNIYFQKFYDSPNNYLSNNFFNYRRKLFEDNNSAPLNKNKEKENIPIHKKEDLSPENDKIEKIEMNNNNLTKKFFTDYGGFGYKCSCSKTNCNRYYCECYRSSLYCIDCNCKNCQNKPPENVASNRHPLKTPVKPKTELVICTCTKSGCNKKYCECYKNGTKCNSSCRCVKCENRENGKKVRDELYKCCLANSIYIIKNKIIEDEIAENNLINEKINKILVKKRKRTISTQK